MIILGIDPGSSRLGFGVIEDNNGQIKLLSYGTIENSEKENKNKLTRIANQLEELIKLWKPEKAGVEKIFFTKNQKTGIQVAEARGVIIHSLAKNNINIKEYRPQEIKNCLTGNIKADKKSVAKMVKYFLKIDALEGHDDASDALAIAITRSFDKDFFRN